MHDHLAMHYHEIAIQDVFTVFSDSQCCTTIHRDTFSVIVQSKLLQKLVQISAINVLRDAGGDSLFNNKILYKQFPKRSVELAIITGEYGRMNLDTRRSYRDNCYHYATLATRVA